MPTTTFDPRIEPNVFLGEFTRITLKQDIAGQLSNLAIDPTEPCSIEMEWRVIGSEVAMRMHAIKEEPPGSGTRNWRVYAYANPIGPGTGIQLGTVETKAVGTITANQMSWTHVFQVPANSLPEHELAGGPSGVYKICVVVFADSELPSPGNDIIGFGEIPLIIAESLL